MLHRLPHPAAPAPWKVPTASLLAHVGGQSSGFARLSPCQWACSASGRQHRGKASALLKGGPTEGFLRRGSWAGAWGVGTQQSLSKCRVNHLAPAPGPAQLRCVQPERPVPWGAVGRGCVWGEVGAEQLIPRPGVFRALGMPHAWACPRMAEGPAAWRARCLVGRVPWQSLGWHVPGHRAGMEG